MVSREIRQAWRFFYENAGWAVPPGKAACALALAKVEVAGQQAGLIFVWEDDPEGWHSFHFDRRMGYLNLGEPTPKVIECCTCYGPNGQVLAGLGGVWDADSDYRRVVEAEMAGEALGRLE